MSREIKHEFKSEYSEPKLRSREGNGEYIDLSKVSGSELPKARGRVRRGHRSVHKKPRPKSRKVRRPSRDQDSLDADPSNPEEAGQRDSARRKTVRKHRHRSSKPKGSSTGSSSGRKRREGGDEGRRSGHSFGRTRKSRYFNADLKDAVKGEPIKTEDHLEPTSDSNHLTERYRWMRANEDASSSSFGNATDPNSHSAATNPPTSQSADTTRPIFDPSKVTEEMAVDCEMVGVGPRGSKSILARVAIVNNRGDIVYHKFVKPTEYVTDYRHWITGITHSDIQNGEFFSVVKNEVGALIYNKVIVGHAIDNDLEVLQLFHPPELIRDTSRHRQLLKDFQSRSLKSLTREILGKTIQNGTHSPIEDAQCVMEIYLRLKNTWFA